MSLENLSYFPERNDDINATDFSNNNQLIQSNFEYLLNNIISLGNNNSFTGINEFTRAEGQFYNFGFGIEAITVNPAIAMTMVNPIKLFDTTSNSITAVLPKLNDGILGKIAILDFKTKGGSYTVTVNCGTGDTLNATGNNRIVLDAVDDFIVLLAISTTRWLVLVNNSCTLSTV